MSHFNPFFPYVIPPALTALVCFFLVALTIRTGKIRRENQFFTIFCILQALLYLANTLYVISPSEKIALFVCRFIHLFYAFIIPVGVQFVHAVAGIKHRKKLVRGLYLFSLAVSPLSMTDYMIVGMRKYFFGYFPHGGPVFFAFGGIGLVATIYIASILLGMFRQTSGPVQKTKALYLLYGIVISAALTVANTLPVFGVGLYPPGNFGFIPMGLMAYGLFRYNILEATKGSIAKGLFPAFFTLLVWGPLGISIIFWLMAPSALFYFNLFDRIFPYAFPPILSFLVCFIIATFCFMQRQLRLSTILFGLICTFWGYLNLDITLNMMVTDAALALQIARAAHFFLVLQLGVSVHFYYSVLQRPQRWSFVYPCYMAGLILMPFTMTHWYFQGVYEFSWGFFAKKNIAFDFFSFLSFIAVAWGIFLFIRASRTETDTNTKKMYFYVLTGVLITGLLNLCNIPALNGIDFYPLGNLTFIPILIMGYGLFRYDILRINIYTIKRILEKLVGTVLFLGYAALICVCFWALKYDMGLIIGGYGQVYMFNPSYIFGKIYPYGIPPLVALFCSAYISVISLRIGKRQAEALVFSLFCLLISFVSFDVLLNGIIDNAAMGLEISRWDHLFLVFTPALSLHLVYYVTRRENMRRFVLCSYVIAFFMMPATQTQYYIQGMSHYYWGFYAKGAFLFYLFGFFCLISILYGAFILTGSYSRTVNPIQRHRLFYLALGFIIIGILYTGNILILMGYRIYPPGNFVFIPLLLLSYGLFKNNLKDVSQISKKFFSQAGLFAALLIMAGVFKKIFPTDRPAEIYLLALIVSAFILSGISYVLKYILAFVLGEQSRKFEQVNENLLHYLSKTQTPYSIFEISGQVVFKELLSSRFIMLIAKEHALGNNADKPKSTLFFSGWDARCNEKDMFSSDDRVVTLKRHIELENDSPFLRFFDEYGKMISREEINELLLDQDFSASSDKLYTTERVLFYQAEIILPVYFEANLICLILFGNKNDNTAYSTVEKGFIRNLGLSLGYYLKNAKLLQNFEDKVKERTKELQNALLEARLKEREISHINHVIRAVNSTLDFDEVMISVMALLKEIFSFETFAINLIDQENQILKLYRVYGDFINEELKGRLKSFRASIKEKDSILTYTIAEKRPFYVTGITEKTSMLPLDRKIYEILPFFSMVIFPLELQNRVIGCVALFSHKKHIELTPSDISKALNYIPHIATATNNALLYEDLNKASREAEKANRAKSEFLANMSHEIRTPLNSVMGAAEMLKRSKLTTENRQLVDMLQINSELLLNIINDIIDLSMIEAGKMRLDYIEFNLKELFEKTCRIFEESARKKGLDLHMNIDSCPPEVARGDPVRLQQVLVNLIGNAIKFTSQGHISVECGYSPEDSDRAGFIFSVEDTGIGMAEDKQETVFESFTQADSSTTRKFGGTGLGLSISKRIVELMGGRIWVESTPGIGSTFYFFLPLKRLSFTPSMATFGAASGEISQADFGAGTIGKQKLQAKKEDSLKAESIKFLQPGRILLVEDYEYNRIIISHFLKEAPFEIDIAENGADAVDKFKTNKYDFVLMDIQMPVMDGYDATREIRKIEKKRNSARTPVIALSAFALTEEKEKSLDAGCDAHLSKPIQIDDLLAMLERFSTA